MLYKFLRQRHPEYDPVLWQELDILYEGGYKAMRNAKAYLSVMDGEKPQKYEDRVRLVSYVGYMGQIIDFFCASLFEAGIDVTEAVDADDPETAGEPAQADEFWEDFSDNADLQRTPFSTLLRNCVRDALVKRRSLLLCDFPTIPVQPSSRAEEKKLGADRGYAVTVPLEQLVDWELDEFGRFAWCILYETSTTRTSPSSLRGAVTHTWTVWTMFTPEVAAAEVVDAAQGVQSPYRMPVRGAPVGPDPETVARWEKYEVTVPPDFTDWKDELDIPRVDGAETSFDRIPLLMLELPMGLWAGNYLGPMALEHWARRSMLVGAEARNMIAVGYVNLDTSGGAAGGMLDLEPDEKRTLRAKGLDLVLPGSLQFAEPTGHAYSIVDGQLKDLKDEMFRVAHQMAMSVDTSAGAMSRSGQSKMSDKRDIAVVLGALAGYAKDHAVQVYETISQGRNESDVVWTPRGMDQFIDDDRAVLLTEAVQVDLIGIPSATWKKEYKTQLAFKLAPNLPPETQDTIRQEILDGVDNEQELDDLTLDQQKESVQDTPTPGDQLKAQTEVAKVQAKNGPPQGPPGKGAPPGKSNGKSNGKQAGAKSS